METHLLNKVFHNIKVSIVSYLDIRLCYTQKNVLSRYIVDIMKFLKVLRIEEAIEFREVIDQLKLEARKKKYIPNRLDELKAELDKQNSQDRLTFKELIK